MLLYICFYIYGVLWSGLSKFLDLVRRVKKKKSEQLCHESWWNCLFKWYENNCKLVLEKSASIDIIKKMTKWSKWFWDLSVVHYHAYSSKLFSCNFDIRLWVWQLEGLFVMTLGIRKEKLLFTEICSWTFFLDQFMLWTVAFDSIKLLFQLALNISKYDNQGNCLDH